jgi:hypothetical protein
MSWYRSASKISDEWARALKRIASPLNFTPVKTRCAGRSARCSQAADTVPEGVQMPPMLNARSHPRLSCTMCGSDQLATRSHTGLERLMVFLTRKRKYRCLICKHKFRAVDRRALARDRNEAAETAHRSRIVL